MWSLAGQKIEFVDIKIQALQMLQKPLLKLLAMQQNDPDLQNVINFRELMTDFFNDLDGTRTHLSKKLRYLVQRDESKLTTAFNKFMTFKVQKHANFRGVLGSFLDMSASLFLFWMQRADGHPNEAMIRSILAKVVEFYDEVVLQMCQHDLDMLMARFVRKMKRVAYND